MRMLIKMLRLYEDVEVDGDREEDVDEDGEEDEFLEDMGVEDVGVEVDRGHGRGERVED